MASAGGDDDFTLHEDTPFAHLNVDELGHVPEFELSVEMATLIGIGASLALCAGLFGFTALRRTCGVKTQHAE